MPVWESRKEREVSCVKKNCRMQIRNVAKRVGKAREAYVQNGGTDKGGLWGGGGGNGGYEVEWDENP